ncbi:MULTISPECIES: D-2-hydroxyacid dehydrogenase [unclassified Chelatococcus]|uniref:D-2-hydroxyacid dehydrogenase n=1 Tax=unclassified Chelatococcus TaxID=2638111 RepID=UPI001BCB1717|nr:MULTISPECIES: D-2-hydroxyacid dehydrogenase [unclassified Chelatococcus]CAH1660361.1 D-3-phosphoglycerate dehydrogenase [Hyphomicrobiales bacterium]MBS7741093.1 D-2-hydroxyacid dehydrogenase [Chelatococcus sp. HY11]MBX3545279.1 D-2-hydroxyacid dehydrogenase [Chelatococcus sp.]MCO5077912.1 D-2-hydroxyacid dehydrogenase [Chelatococcus sp.]CAH1683468.1 D-3-phosphoglycerate dehydrogenase [Hyphomicrobiales bacterium]
MRIHIQNTATLNSTYTVDEALWAAALARNGEDGAAYQVTYGNTLDDYAGAIADAELLLSHNRSIPDLFPVEAPKLKYVMCGNAGLDSLAPFDWLPPGVTLLTNSGTHADKAGEYAIMALLMLANRIPAFVAAQGEARWNRQAGRLLRDGRLTVVGLGALGGAAAHHGKAFGMHVTGVRTSATPHPACDRVVATSDVDSVLPETDYLVLACPLTPATRNILDRRRLALLPRHAGLVNIGRGQLVDEPALCDALDTGALAGAVLDVFVTEPLPRDARIWTTPDVVITPHMSADDPARYMANTLDVLFTNMKALREGRPLPNTFDITRGY